jgi:hypothetical protein
MSARRRIALVLAVVTLATTVPGAAAHAKTIAFGDVLAYTRV